MADYSIRNSEGKVSITKTIKSKDGVTKEISCREVENGFVVEIYKSWQDKEDGYQSETKTYISKDNPFLSKDKKEEEDKPVIPSDVENYFSGILDFGL